MYYQANLSLPPRQKLHSQSGNGVGQLSSDCWLVGGAAFLGWNPNPLWSPYFADHGKSWWPCQCQWFKCSSEPVELAFRLDQKTTMTVDNKSLPARVSRVIQDIPPSDRSSMHNCVFAQKILEPCFSAFLTLGSPSSTGPLQSLIN